MSVRYRQTNKYLPKSHGALAEVNILNILTLPIIFTGRAQAGLGKFTFRTMVVCVTDTVGEVISDPFTDSMDALNPVEFTGVPMFAVRSCGRGQNIEIYICINITW